MVKDKRPAVLLLSVALKVAHRVPRLWLAPAVAAALIVTSCATVYVNSDHATIPLSLSSDNRTGDSRTVHFRSSERALYVLWGLVPLVQPDAGAMASQQAAGADEVTNLRVTTQFDVLDVLVFLLLGPASLVTSSVTVEGDAVTYSDGN